ncbi:MAG: ATP-binding cassette domain-containing protein, partial [Lentisphaerae bacterium]|nr:ATP-binding cassette domain-containing protein [Lentisphaerota bacterium]
SELRGRSIGFVFQSFHLIPQLTVLENVELPLFYQRIPARKRLERARSALGDVGMDHRCSHLPGQLSGGESQRTAVARALVTDPDVLLADEPTGNLDSRTGAEIIGLFSSLHERGRTVIVITHDQAIAEHLPRVAHMSDGEIVRDERR